MLAAHAQMQLGVGGAAHLAGHIHQLAHAGLVQLGEGIVLVDLLVVIGVQELARVITAEAESHLSQVVGAEGEEVRLLGDLIGGQRGPGDLDHGAHQVLHVGAGLLDDGIGGLHHDLLHVCQLLDLAHQGDHDLRHHGPLGMLGLDVQRSLDDGAGLHGGDLRIGDRQTAAPVTHHGVELVQAGDDGLDLRNALAHVLGQQLDVGLLSGHELVQRGIQETDGDRQALHGLIDALEVGLLHRLQNSQSGLTLLHGVGADHSADGGNAVCVKEHVLGPAQADALSAELPGLGGVVGGVGIGADLQAAVLVGPAHDPAELAADRGVHRGDGAVVDLAGGTVDGQPVAFVEGLAGELKLLILLVHLDGAAAGDAALAHAAGHHGRVGGHAAPHSQDALSSFHALDILRRGLQPDQDHLLAALGPGLGVLSGEDDLAAGGAGRGGQGAADHGGLLQHLAVKLGMQQGVQGAGIDHGHGLLFVDHPLVHQVAGDLERSSRGALAVAGLQHIELAVLHGELHVLHIVIVILQDLANLLELGEGLGELFAHFADGHGSPDAGHHVLALGIGQELTEQLLLAGGGVAGEGHAGAAVVAHVAEGHGLDVDGGAPGVGDVVVPAVHVGAGVVPGAEHGLDGAHQLLLGVGGEVCADLGLVLGLELAGQLLQVVGSQLHVLGDAAGLLHLVDELLKVLLAHFHHYVGVHLDEAAVAVPGPAGVAGLLGQHVHHVLVQTQIQDGVHHAGHGGPGAGTHGDQQGVLQIAELLAGDALQLGDILHDLRLDPVVDLLAVLIVLGAGLGGDGEALGHRQANVGHFGQIGTLAAKQLPHIGVALAEQIDIFFAHVVQTSLSCRSRKSGGLQSAVKRLAHFDNDNIILGIFSENNT